MTEPLDYDHLVRDFEQSLLTQLFSKCGCLIRIPSAA